MRTSKPFAAISYNTKEFLQLKLEELTKAKIISVWHFIHHKSEDDEAGKKDHIHLYIEPAKRVLVEDLNEQFCEPDLTNSKPRQCKRFKPSRFDHWYLYGIHDKKYLQMKGLERKFHYAFPDVVTSDTDELLIAVKEIDMGEVSKINMLNDAIRNGETLEHLILTGQVPINSIRNYQIAWEILKSSKSTSQQALKRPRGES